MSTRQAYRILSLVCAGKSIRHRRAGRYLLRKFLIRQVMRATR